METVLRSARKTVTIGPGNPTVLIGERINPTGKKRLAAALAEGNLDVVVSEALAQVEAGADVLDVNVGAAGVEYWVEAQTSVTRLVVPPSGGSKPATISVTVDNLSETTSHIGGGWRLVSIPLDFGAPNTVFIDDVLGDEPVIF